MALVSGIGPNAGHPVLECVVRVHRAGVLYHSPHDELAWHGQLPAEDALPITKSAADLANRLPALLDDPTDVRTSLHATFVEQIDGCREVSSAVRSADVITARLA